MARPTQTRRGDHNWHTWIGTDEAGKGDYFGSLAVAGVYVNSHTHTLLKTMGVRDGKQLSDSQVRKLARKIREDCADCISLVELGPAEYNKQYDTFRSNGQNLNNLLASLHSEVILDLLNEHTECRHVLVDRFAKEEVLAMQLRRSLSLDIELVQMPKAESDVAVAAASIIARDAFLQRLEQLSRDYQIQLPKGAFQVIDTGKQFVERHGNEALHHVAKRHFRTTMDILGAEQ